MTTVERLQKVWNSFLLFNQLLQETSKKVVEGLVRVVVLEIMNSDFNGLVVAIFSEFCSGSAHVINSNRA